MRFPFNQQSNPYEAKFTLCNKVARGKIYSRGEEEGGRKEGGAWDRACNEAGLRDVDDCEE